MDSNSTEVPKRVARPPSNWAQLISAGTALVTVALAIYALFFSSASQALIQYLQSELAYRNKVISNLQDTKDNLERSISARELQFQKLTAEANELQSSIASLAKQRSEAEAQVRSLKEEQSVLSQAVIEARSRSTQNEFSYIKERLVGRSEAVIVAPWTLTIIEDEKQTSARRETLWPQYLAFYRKTAASFPDAQRSTAERIVSLFEKQCARFRTMVFDIPVPVRRADANSFERLEDPRIDQIRKKALAVEDDIKKCLRSVRDDSSIRY